VKHLLSLWVPILLLAVACSPGTSSPPPTGEPQAASPITANPPAPTVAEPQSAPPPTAQPPAPTAPPQPGNAEPTMETCRAWLRETHSLDYPNHGCEEHAAILNSVAADGAAAIPLGDNRFFIARFPDDWERLDDRTLIVALHGNGGCTERMYQWWSKPAAQHHYALVTLEYAEADATTEEGYAFDDAPQVYERLRTALDLLAAHCPLDHTKIIYHGFSRGSALSFPLAMMDRSEEGSKLFAAFISDSGTEFPDTGGQVPDYLQTAPADAYAGARFWLYCGGRDHEGKTCEGMKRMGPLLDEHGAEVATYRYEPGGHGIFATVKPGGPTSPALDALLEYIEGVPQP